MYKNLLKVYAQSAGLDLDEDLLEQINAISASVEEVFEIYQSNMFDSKGAEDKRLKHLRRDIKKRGRELLRELSGYYNTESGMGLSREERKQFDLQIDEEIKRALEQLETMAPMSDSERLSYVMKEYNKVAPGMQNMYQGGSSTSKGALEDVADMLNDENTLK